MREAHPEERATGVEWYASDADGTGGRLRETPESFRVREIEAVDPEPVGADPGSYPHLVARVTLRDRETNAFASALASRLGISRERVSWAGTKDKRAVTTQLFSVRTEADDLPAVGGADLEVLGRAGRPVLFGDLAGNAFEIEIHDPDRPEQAARVLSELRAFAAVGGTGGNGKDGNGENGHRTGGRDDGPVVVPNFFGPQRFGSYRPVTDAVGFAILRGDWEGAVRTYVCERSEHEPADTRRARATVEDRWGDEWGALAELLPGKLRYERALLSGLAEAETGAPDAGAASAEDPFRAALDRLPENLQAMFVHAAQSRPISDLVSRRMARGLPLGEAVAGDVVCFRARDAPADLPLPDPDRTQRVTDDRLRSVNRHCARGRAFVTAPLIGTDTAFGDGEPGEIERAVLAEHDLTRAAFDLPAPFGSEGTRRAVLVRTDPSVARDPLSLSFRLPKGSYATTLLREVLKTSPRRLA